MADFIDKNLTCIESGCKAAFVFTSGEQAFYNKQGFTDEPKRCKPCRDKRKAAREARDSHGGGGDGNHRKPAAFLEDSQDWERGGHRSRSR